MPTFLLVFGTRPEAIKMAPVVRELKRRAMGAVPGKPVVRAIVCATAQHRQMLDQVLDIFGIRPDYDLDIMGNDQTPARVSAAVFQRLEPILQSERPDWVVVQGDTTTVAATSLAAFYAGTRVAHVEAGLRTRNKWRPFPEEINRRVAGVVADLHFAPTPGAKENLLRESVDPASVLVTGNPVIDALRWAAELPPPPAALNILREAGIVSGLLDHGTIETVGLNCPDPPPADSGGRRTDGLVPRLVLVTAHRRENFGPPLANICRALNEIAECYADEVRIVYPVHPNPNVWGPVHRYLDGVRGIVLTHPVDYLTLVHLMKRSHLILTDSGGIQEEAPSLSKPVLVLREETERPEAVEAGTVRLVGTDPERILTHARSLLDDTGEYTRMARAQNPYGDGRAAERIVAALLSEPVEEFAPAAPQRMHTLAKGE